MTMRRVKSAVPLPGSSTGRRVDLVVGGIALMTFAQFASVSVSGLPSVHVWPALAVYLGIAVLIDRVMPAGTPGPGLGAANRVTLVRLVFVCWLCATAVLPAALLTDALLWLVAGMTLLALGLDGVDGYLARQRGVVSRFGARFDEEVDAGLIMVLAMLAWRSDQVGVWVLLIGLMRYAFVIAGWAVTALQAELFPSVRRKAVCVVQVGVLPLCLLPVVSPALSTVFAAAALLALTASFWVDVRWLMMRRESPSRPT